VDTGLVLDRGNRSAQSSRNDVRWNTCVSQRSELADFFS